MLNQYFKYFTKQYFKAIRKIIWDRGSKVNTCSVCFQIHWPYSKNIVNSVKNIKGNSGEIFDMRDKGQNSPTYNELLEILHGKDK